MSANIITTDDLREFKLDLLEEFKEILQSSDFTKPKKWMKSNQVREMLGISPGTLQNLRLNGTLPFSKIGGVMFYDYDEIISVINDHKVNIHR